MPSSKGNPTDPELREKIKEEVKNEEKGTLTIQKKPSPFYHDFQPTDNLLSGGGKGSWSAWKAGELARRYEAQGGDYEDTGDNKNKSQKGAPEKKSKN